jgi:hypothetical protein
MNELIYLAAILDAAHAAYRRAISRKEHQVRWREECEALAKFNAAIRARLRR